MLAQPFHIAGRGRYVGSIKLVLTVTFFLSSLAQCKNVSERCRWKQEGHDGPGSLT